MKRKITIWAALILAGDLLLGTVSPSLGLGTPAVYAAGEFGMSATSPAAGEKNISLGSSINLSFDRVVNPQSGDITITQAGNPFVTVSVGTLGLVGSSNYYEIRWGADKPLEPNKSYTVSIPKGLFKDGSGAESSAASWEFTTSPETSQGVSITEFSPVNNSRPDSAALNQLSFKLGKKLQKGGGSAKLISSADNTLVQEFKFRDGEPNVNVQTDGTTTSVSMTLASKLNPGSTYYVLIDNYALKDDENRTFSGVSSGSMWSFTAKSTGVGANVSPAGGSTGVNPTSDLQLGFDRPMMPNAGVISLTPANNPGGTRYFNVNSTAVTGGGTPTITIDAASEANPLLEKTMYTVTVPQGAFHDQDGNLFPASGPLTWSYTTSEVKGFGIEALSPADRSESVSLNPPIKITFNRNVVLNNAVAGPVILYKGDGTKLESTLSVGSSAKEFIVTPAAAFDNNTTYYLDIANGAFVDANNSQVIYGGLSGKNAWSFQTYSLDKTAPVLKTALVDNNRTIRLIYDEALKTEAALLPSSFAVTVNDEKRAIDSISIQGDSIYIKLSTGITVGQVIKVSYSGGLRPIQDLSGNNASTFSQYQVTNGVQSALTTIKDGTLTGKTVLLNFNDTLQAVNPNAYSQFSVYADGYSLGTNAISSSGAKLNLSLDNAATNAQVIRVSYSAGSYPVADTNGQSVANFSDFYIRNSGDNVPPVFQSAAGSGNKIVLTYNEGISSGSLPMNSQFSVLVGSKPNYVTAVAAGGTQVTLTLQSALAVNQPTTVSYVPGTTGIADLNGNRAPYLNQQSVNISGTTVSDISSATITGDELLVTFNKTMQASSGLNANQFGVRFDGSTVGIQSYYISGSTLKLTLSSVVKSGQTVDLSYMSGSGTISDQNGNLLTSFTALSVQNMTGVAGNSSTAGRPSYLGTLAASEFGKEYPLLKTDSATAADDRSVYSQSVKRYNLTAERLAASYDYVYKQGTSALAFEVPSTDLSAYVSVPLKPLLDAVNRDSKAAFLLRHGDHLYRLALNDVNMNSLAATLIADSNNISLVLRLEKVPAGTFTPFEQKLQSQGLQTVTGLMDIRLSAAVSSNYANTTALSVPAEYAVRTTATLNSDQASAARLDLAYYDAAYLPTKLSSAGSYTVITASTIGNQVVGTFLSTRSFTDMNTHWSKAIVSQLAAKNIIDSSYGSTFKPEQKITRAEFAVMLSRGLGLLGSRETAQRFRDVQPSTQTGDYIGAAAKAGIITGNTDATFRPNDNITREQLAIMIIRAMEYTGRPITLNGTSATALVAFKDRSKIQNQAAEFVAKAVQQGIILGMTTTEFQPQGNATRAQAAVMLQRMLTMAGYL
ncbi:Ig-like domain-containing protein [Paenibacillus riograndensis]|uniref:Putative membrane protein n=1 Tax=Paenibacillus riograndensis SBR5 TaxID=1073571 RepID=A0A0E3WJE3_9BACL|nr:Ig-like domain-containing protein [Paenibacillus riograndensis]CQR58638.1 putative membrane protein [Paenibacillus riograndensis SBR5]